MEVPGRRFNLTGCDDDTNSELHCEPCEENHRIQSAISYCVDCNEFICTVCEQTHRGSKISRHHTILDQATMPKQKMTSGDGNFCPRHDGKVFEYYCTQHGDLCCGVCVNLKHRNCNTVQFIKDIAANFENSDEFKGLKSKFEELIKMLKASITLADDNANTVKQRFHVTLSDIKQFRDDLNSILDELEQEAIKEAESIKDQELKDIELVKDSCKSIQSNINTISSDIDNSIKYKQDQQLLLSVKTAEKKVEAFEKELSECGSRNNIIYKTFRGHDELLNCLKSVQSLGKLEESVSELSKPNGKTSTETEELRATGTPKLSLDLKASIEGGTTKVPNVAANQGSSTAEGYTQSAVLAKDPRKWIANFMGEIRTNLHQDRNNCYITAGEELNDDTLVLVDNNNCCLKYVNTVKKQTGLLIKLSCKPWDITLFKEKQYVVSAEKKLLFINVENQTVSLDREMPIDGDCKGIDCIDDKIVVSCAAPNPCVKLINNDGDVIHTIKHDRNGQLLFINPWYLRTSPDRKHILVSDFENHRVTSVDINGHVISYYADKNLKGPTGLAVVKNGVVFLAGRKSHNLHLISAVPRHLQLLLNRRAGEELPQAVIWCERGSTLFVSHNWRTKMCNTVSVYKIQ